MTPFIGQLALFSCSTAPRGWALCNGQLLPVGQYQALFTLLGTQYGGNGQTTFALPNLQGCVAVGAASAGSTYKIGQTGGEANHTLTIAETPSHVHTLEADATTAGSANTTAPGGNVLGQSQGLTSDGDQFAMDIYAPSTPTGQLAQAAIGAVGGQPHSNMMPSLGLNYCIALAGIFPSRN